MKIKLHIPTEEYGFVEIETEAGSIQEAVDIYKIRPTTEEGITTKEFNDALDQYLTDNTGETDVYVRMNTSQKAVFQEIKKSLKRIKAKQEETNY